MKRTSLLEHAAARLALAFLLTVTAGAVAASAADATVAADGTGQFKSVQDAINAAPPARPGRRWVIHIKPGVYKELIYLQREKRFVSLVGEDASKTVLTYDLHANTPGADGKPLGTFRTASVTVDADDFAAENITFENAAGPVGQALAIRLDGDRATFRNCRFLGWQDTILANRGRHYFESCYVAGHVDFIFGAATAFFERCHLHALRDGYLTAASTPEDQPHGFVFSNCRVTAETPSVKIHLGRPWRPFASVAFVNTEMSASVRPEGWHNWGHAAREKTVRYAEYKSTGAGANARARVPWARQLTEAEAADLTAEKVLAGHDNWNPRAKETRPPVTDVTDATNAPRTGASNVAAAPCASRGGPKADIEYSRAGGESLKLDACVPDGAGPFPAAILVHGGGWSGGDKAKGVDPLFAPLARARVAWFSVNYRHAPKHRHPASVEDVEAAVRWVKAHAAEFRIDPRRLALVGESAGGHLVALAVVRAKEETRVAAVVPFYAPVDLEADTERRGGLSASLKALFGREKVDDDALRVLRESSPINHVREGLPPFLLVHGTGDMSVPYNQSTRMQARLRAAGVSAELITIDGGTHGMARWEDLDPTYKEKVVAWLAQRLAAAPPAQSVVK